MERMRIQKLSRPDLSKLKIDLKRADSSKILLPSEALRPPSMSEVRTSKLALKGHSRNKRQLL